MSPQLPAQPYPITFPRSGRKLAKEIFAASLPEQYIRTLPAQSVYLAIKENGLESSADLVQILTLEQLRVCLDFDLWDGDTLQEDNLWSWLALPDAAGTDGENLSGLALLQKILKAFDLKIVALMLSRHVEHYTFEEPSDTPPGVDFFTPDKGFTWLSFKNVDESQRFLLGRFVALIFETNADLFYQMLAIPGVASEAELEEESYQDRTRRLNVEGVPDLERAHELCTPLNEGDLLRLISERSPSPMIDDIRVVEPLIYQSVGLEPLQSLVRSITEETRGGREQFEIELTQILNAALIRWRVPAYEHEDVALLGAKVRGAINLGLSLALQRSDRAALDIYSAIGLRPLFCAGLALLMQVRAIALKIEGDEEKLITDDAPRYAVITAARDPFPCIPEFLSKADSEAQFADPVKSVSPRLKAIELMEELAQLKIALELQ